MKWLTPASRAYLERGYLQEWVTPEERIMDIAKEAERTLWIEWFADKFYGYMSEGFYSLSSPVWSNYWTDRGLPISCFTSYLDDDMANILYTNWEVGMMSKYGWGTAGYFGALRPRGADIRDNWVSSGAVHFMQLFDKWVDVVSQGSVRRGSFAGYLPVEHPDISEFLEIGNEWNPIQRITTGVTVTDKWLKEMSDSDLNKKWVREKRKIWAKVIQSRSEKGYPYIFFTDNVNNWTVDVYKDKGHKIYSSNLCTEILLPTSKHWSFVCNLSSINIAEYDNWKDTDAVETLVYFLDAVMTEFINKIERLPEQSRYFMKRAYDFAVANRAIGLGVLGYHTYLQENLIAFESPEASEINKEIFKKIQTSSYSASEKLAELFWEPSVLKWYGRRNATLNAVAPTTSSAFILGQVSQSIEPIWSNCYVKDMAKAKVTIKNPKLKELLKEKGQDTKDVWASIRDNDGSVQHLDFLSTNEKNIFKTFSEINQYVIIDQASDRQKYIDQGQSLNLMIHPDTPTKEINSLYLDAWRQGIKTLYYQHSKSASQELRRKISCTGCEA